MSETPHSFFATIFNQRLDDLAHDALAMILVDIWNGAIIALMVYVFLRIRHRMQLRSRRDNKHVSASLNYVDANGNFILRTIGEGGISIEELFENIYLRKIFIQARKRTSPGNIILKYPSSVTTEIASVLMGYITEGSSHGFFREASGLKVHKRTFVFMATHEYYGMMRVQKIRLIITPLEFLENLPSNADNLKFERERHRDRLQTLQDIKAAYEALTTDEKLDYSFELAFEE